MAAFRGSLVLATLLLCCLGASGLVDVFSEGESNGYYSCVKIPALLTTQKGSLLAFAEARRFNCADHTWIDLVLKRSVDGGNTWSPLQVVYSNSSSTSGNITIGNAAPVQDPVSGRIFLPFCRNNAQVLLTYSDDDGLTWSPARNLSGVVAKGWNWIGTGPPGSLVLPSGRILVPAYHGPFAWDDGDWTQSHVMLSDDGGETWSLGGSVGSLLDRANENQAVLLANGSVMINARTLSPQRVRAVSDDGGQTFGAAQPIEGLQEPWMGCEGSTIRAPNSSALLYSGLHTDKWFRYNLSLHISTDDGASFTPIKVIDAGPSGYSTLQILPDSSVALLFERSNITSSIFVPQRISFEVVLTAEETRQLAQRWPLPLVH